MIFESLYESAKRDELLLVPGGLCQYHLRRDKQLTIGVIIATRPGAGSEMLEVLKAKRPDSIFAKCPIDLPSNLWYFKKGFTLEGQDATKTGRVINLWRLKLSPTDTQI